MSRTAQPIATGPFYGFFSEGATLYRLDPPCIAGGPTKRGVKTCEVSHIIVYATEMDEVGGPEVTVFAADARGVVDSHYYSTFGPVLDLNGTSDPNAALARLGYDA